MIKRPNGLFCFFSYDKIHLRNKKENMFLLTDLSKVGYEQIKKDRQALTDKVKQLEILIEEIDLALPYLEAIYDPKIRISKDERRGVFVAWTSIPFNETRLRITVTLGKIEKYPKGIESIELIDLSRNMINAKIREEFPQHFRDGDSH
jgi:hypothetical protein